MDVEEGDVAGVVVEELGMTEWDYLSFLVERKLMWRMKDRNRLANWRTYASKVTTYTKEHAEMFKYRDLNWRVLKVRRR